MKDKEKHHMSVNVYKGKIGKLSLLNKHLNAILKTYCRVTASPLILTELRGDIINDQLLQSKTCPETKLRWDTTTTPLLAM